MANIHQGFPTPSFSTVVDISANFLAGPIAVQETGIKTIPIEKKCKKAKWLSGSSVFSKTSLNIRKFTVHVLLKPGLENFEYYFTSV